MLLSKLLFMLIFTASKAKVARSNRAGQAKGLTGREMILKPPPGGFNLVINHY